MKPTSIGEVPTKMPTAEEPLIKFDDNELRLLHQEFLMRPGIRVFDFLNENHAVVNDFVRLECGEVLESESK
jgi:translation elongation factor EF-Ts